MCYTEGTLGTLDHALDPGARLVEHALDEENLEARDAHDGETLDEGPHLDLFVGACDGVEVALVEDLVLLLVEIYHLDGVRDGDDPMKLTLLEKQKRYVPSVSALKENFPSPSRFALKITLSRGL